MKRKAWMLLLALAGPACGGDSAPAPPPAEAVTVATGAVRAERVTASLESGGVVAAARTAVISSRIVASIRQVLVTAGQQVNAGQPLIILDAPELAAQSRQAGSAAEATARSVERARSEVAAAEADQIAAASWHRRVAALHERRSATTQELEDAVARLAGAQARLAAGRAHVEEATSAMAASRAGSQAATALQGFATIAAPFAGVVSERLVDPGSVAAPGVPLLRVDSLGDRFVEMSVAEHRAPFLTPGAAVEITLDQHGGQAIAGRVVEVSRVSPANRTFLVRARLASATSAPPGTFARVTFAGAPRDVLVVPSAAVVRRGQVDAAFVVDQGIARLRLLHLGPPAGGGIEVLAGLRAGDRVVLTPPAVLTDGRAVTANAARSGQ